jgi:membrane protein DedA with SNARE-associated domain
MDMDTIARFGPLAVALGAFIEGETTVLLAGAGLALGLLDFWTVVGAALVGSLVGDQFFFWLGRIKGAAYLSGHPRFGARVARVGKILLRHRLLLLGGYRFVYGLRGIVPFAYGLSPLCWRVFLLANLITAALWSLLVTWIGYHAGALLLEPAVAKRLPFMGLAVVLVAGAVILIRRQLKTRSEFPRP